MTQITSFKDSAYDEATTPYLCEGLFVVGQHAVIFINYKSSPIHFDLDYTVDRLTDVIDDLSPSQSGRAIVECRGGERQFWLLLHVSLSQPTMVSQMQGALQQREVLLERLRSTGLTCEAASSEAVEAMLREFPQPHVENRRVVDHQGRTVVTLTLRETGEVTRPGFTRQLVNFLSSRGPLAYLVLDFRNAPQGWARFDLTLVLTATNKTEGRQAVQAAEDIVFTTLGGLAMPESPKQTMNTLRRIAPFNRAYPRLPASAGNIADLFPL